MKLGWRLFFRYLSGSPSKAKQAGNSPFSSHAAAPRATTRQILQARCMRYLRALAYVFNAHTLIVLLIANISVYICLEADLRFNMDFSLVATGTIFPLTYTISQAYTRRERATVLIANLKASVAATYYMHRDWDQSDNYPASLGNDSSAWALKAKVLLVELLVAIKNFLAYRSELVEGVAEQRLTAHKGDSQLAGLFRAEHTLELRTDSDVHFAKTLHRLQRKDPSRVLLADCYRAIGMLSVMNEQLTLKAGYLRGGEGGLSRTNQYLRYIISNVEELRMIKEYRTPAMMRHACSLLFHIFAVILAPFFTHFCDLWVQQGHEEGTCVAGYMGATFYVLIVMLLLHCEQDMEHCFAETGLDDMFFTLHEEIDDMVANDKILHTQYSASSDQGNSLAGNSPPGSIRGASPGPTHPAHLAEAASFQEMQHLLQRHKGSTPHIRSSAEFPRVSSCTGALGGEPPGDQPGLGLQDSGGLLGSGNLGPLRGNSPPRLQPAVEADGF